MFKAPPYEVYSVVTGTLRLDGGAMFGVVPKVLWRHKVDVDDENRILLAMRTLVAVDRKRQRVIVVDTGAGTKWRRDKAERFAIDYNAAAINHALAAIGLTERHVTDVVVTHLHFDHNGGLTEWTDAAGGPTRLRFPSARHWVHRDHWRHAHHPTGKDRASFLTEDFAALERSDALSLVDGDEPDAPYPGMAWYVSHGHTPAQLHPIFGTGTQRVMFVGDIIPTAAHVQPAWVMAYDLHPLTTIEEKAQMLARSIDEAMAIAFPHDPRVAVARVTGTPQRPALEDVQPTRAPD